MTEEEECDLARAMPTASEALTQPSLSTPLHNSKVTAELRIPNPLDRAGWLDLVQRLLDAYASQQGLARQDTDQLVYLQITRGGNIIMVQVENEFGSYGTDKPYVSAIRDLVSIFYESGYKVSAMPHPSQSTFA